MPCCRGNSTPCCTSTSPAPSSRSRPGRSCTQRRRPRPIPPPSEARWPRRAAEAVRVSEIGEEHGHEKQRERRAGEGETEAVEERNGIPAEDLLGPFRVDGRAPPAAFTELVVLLLRD